MMINIADGTFKNIQDIKVGEKVSAFEYPFNKPAFADIIATFIYTFILIIT